MNRKMKAGIRSFINEINPMYKVEFQEYDTEVDIINKIIYVGKTFEPETDDYYREFVNRIHPEFEIKNLFLLTLLHEVGHIMTWNEQIANEKAIIYDLIELEYNAECATQEEKKNLCMNYYNIALERNATEWGIWFAETHQELIEKYNWLNNN